jgi:hypothetical protein
MLIYCRSWEVFEAVNRQTALQYRWLAAVNNLASVPWQADGFEVDKLALEKVVLKALLFRVPFIIPVMLHIQLSKSIGWYSPSQLRPYLIESHD